MAGDEGFIEAWMEASEDCRNPIDFFTCITKFGTSSVSSNCFFSISGCTHSLVSTFPRMLTFPDPETQISVDNLSPVFPGYVKTCLRFVKNWSINSMPHPMSSMKCKQRLADKHGSR